MPTTRGNDFIILRFKVDEQILSSRKASALPGLVKRMLDQHAEMLIHDMIARRWNFAETNIEFALQVKKNVKVKET